MSNILQDMSNNNLEVKRLSDAQNPSASGRNDDRLEQILRQPLSDPRESILDELTELAVSTNRTDADNERLQYLFSEMEKFSPAKDIPDNGEADMVFLRGLHEQSGWPAATSIADSAAAENIKTKERSISDLEPPVGGPRRIGKKFLLLAATLVLLLGAVSSQASGDGLLDMFAKWTAEIFHLDESAKPAASIGHNDMVIDELREYDTPQEMLDDFGIKGQLLPTWLPEGVGQPECWATYDDGGGLRLFILYDTEAAFLGFQYKQITKENAANIEKDYRDMNYWDVGETRHYQTTDTTLEKIIWVNGEFECILQGSITGEEAREIVESIYRG